MPAEDIIEALRLIGRPLCLEAADRLADITGAPEGFDLHLRHAGLTPEHAQLLAQGMRQAEAGNAPRLRSFSASYNPSLGDAGATVLAEGLPKTITKLGLVGCSVGDAGARAILGWARDAPCLRMICVEDNSLSADVKSQFQDLASRSRSIHVMV